MKKCLLAFLFLMGAAPVMAAGSYIIVYSTDSNNAVLSVRRVSDGFLQGGDLLTVSGSVVNTDIAALTAAKISQRYWKVSGGRVLEMTAGEKTAADAEVADALLENNKENAKAEFTGTNSRSMAWECFAERMVVALKLNETHAAIQALDVATVKTQVFNCIDNK